MTWTYDETALSTALYAVRLSIGDTSQTNLTTLQDEEIQFRIDNTGSVAGAAIECLRDRIAKVATLSDRQVASVSASRSQLVANLKDLMTELRERMRETGTLTAYAVGVSLSDRDRFKADTDYINPSFRVGMGRHNGSGGTPDERDD